MFGFIKKSLQKTADAIKSIVPTAKESFSKDELEEILLEADVSYELVEKLLDSIKSNKITRETLREKLLQTLSSAYELPEHKEPFVDLIIGVNGAGKTTTIAKLANMYKKDGKKVMLGAGDTFRAAAIEQISLWAKKL
ncbi:MAG: signal recognition particle receptor subunit alpha, partial [Sulfurimonas sp.]